MLIFYILPDSKAVYKTIFAGIFILTAGEGVFIVTASSNFMFNSDRDLQKMMSTSDGPSDVWKDIRGNSSAAA
jgi:hypothetical protein